MTGMDTVDRRDLIIERLDAEIERLDAENKSLRKALISSCDEQRALFRAEGSAPCEAAIEVQALRTENEKLRLDYELLSADCRDLEEDNRRLRLDAERYRWLREIDRPVAWEKLLDVDTKGLRYSAINWLPHRIDDAVDALRGEVE